MIERINFWGIPEFWHYVAYVLPIATFLLMAGRIYLRIRLWWKVGRPEKRWDHPHLRIWQLLKHGIAQIKVLRQSYPGLMHIAIAWSFFVFFLGTALATIDADIFKFLRGGIYLAFKLMLDGFTIVALVGLAMAGYRRFIQRPSRLTFSSPFSISLLAIFLIVLSGLLTESLRLAAVAQEPDLHAGWGPSLAWWTPIGWATAQIWLGLRLAPLALNNIHLGVWVFHLGLVSALFIVLPTSTLVHIVTSPMNIFFAKLDRPKGKLTAAVQWGAGLAGVATLKDFSWKQLMDGDACTACGRCQDACPAHAAGQPLSPKEVILSISDSLATIGPSILTKANGNSNEPQKFTGEIVTDVSLWACTTCGACVEECPVMIEHIDAIVDMRRYLLTQQRADAQLMTALMNLRRYGNSFGKSDRQRARWIKDLEFKIKDIRKSPCHTLWFVGDYASYSPTLTEITIATARVFRQAGVDFGLLYDAERNSGNDVRRVGEEGLFELLAMKNNSVMQKAEFEEIVTTDPHTYNTLRNEYDLIAKNHNVYHYTEVLDRAITEGKLPIKKQLGYAVTFHDPCYLGRYNDIYDAPRNVLNALGCDIHEMPRNRDQALCCGAGGGRIWMEEEAIEERPSENRIREAMSLGDVQYFVVACPKDVTMYSDAVKTAGLEGKIVVKDIIELVEEALQEDAPSEIPKVGSTGLARHE